MSEFKKERTAHFEPDKAAGLWKIVNNENLHSYYIEKALIELAERKDHGVLSACAKFLKSPYVDMWFMVERPLRIMGTEEVVDMMLEHYIATHKHNHPSFVPFLNSVGNFLMQSKIEKFTDALQSTPSAYHHAIISTDWTEAAMQAVENAGFTWLKERRVKIPGSNGLTEYNPNIYREFSNEPW